MEYREIVAVTGIGGLFQLVATKSDGAIVRSLADKTTRFISARLHNVTPLESIEIYTTGDNVRLHDVFQKMKDSAGTPLPDAKTDNNVVKSYFKSVFPEFDEERVYVSDMKKMVKWYELLKENDLLNFEAMHAASEEAAQKAEANETKDSGETNAEREAAEQPAKKTRAKKSADIDAAAEGEEKPKKIAKKKKTENEAASGETEEKPAKKTAKKKKED